MKHIPPPLAILSHLLTKRPNDTNKQTNKQNRGRETRHMKWNRVTKMIKRFPSTFPYIYLQFQFPFVGFSLPFYCIWPGLSFYTATPTGHTAEWMQLRTEKHKQFLGNGNSICWGFLWISCKCCCWKIKTKSIFFLIFLKHATRM